MHRPRTSGDSGYLTHATGGWDSRVADMAEAQKHQPRRLSIFSDAVSDDYDIIRRKGRAMQTKDRADSRQFRAIRLESDAWTRVSPRGIRRQRRWLQQ